MFLVKYEKDINPPKIKQNTAIPAEIPPTTPCETPFEIVVTFPKTLVGVLVFAGTVTLGISFIPIAKYENV